MKTTISTNDAEKIGNMIQADIDSEELCVITAEQLAIYATHPNKHVRASVAVHPNTSSDTLLSFAANPNEHSFIKRELPFNFNTPLEALELLMPTPSNVFVPIHHLCTPEMLSALAHHNSANVRSGVAMNEDTPKHVLSMLATDESELVRAEVAENPSTYKKDLHRLSKDDSRQVLEALAMRDDNDDAMRKRLCNKLSMHVPATCMCPEGYYSNSGI